MEILSTHNRAEEKFKPSQCSSASLCMHPTGIANPSQTTGSMVAEIRKGAPAAIWLTGTSMPCLSIFKPFFFDGNALSDAYCKMPTEKLDESLWWQAERVYRNILKDYKKGKAVIAQQRAHWQKEWLTIENQLISSEKGLEYLDVLSKTAVAKHLECLENWEKELQSLKLKQKALNPFYRRFWNKTNHQVGINY